MEYHAIFSKPNPIPLKKLGYSCYDMHFHTLYSDGAAKISDLLKKLDKLGIKAAITDHNEVKGVKAANSKNIIPGIEVRINEHADLLFYFYDKKDLYDFHKDISKKKKGYWALSTIDMDIEEILDTAKKYSCINSFAHPERNPNKIKNPIYRKAEAIEVINSGISRECNTLAFEAAKKLGKAYTAGSDGHSIYDLGNCLTCAKTDSIGEFLDAIKKKKNMVIGTESRLGKPGMILNHAANRFSNLFRWN